MGIILQSKNGGQICVLKELLKKDAKTKNLIKRLEAGDIAMINHKDLDEIAAMGLAEKKVKCVINAE